MRRVLVIADERDPARQLLADVACFCRRDVTSDVFVEST